MIVPQAKSELMDAAGHYEGQLIGLGQRFWEEVDQHIIWIAENSEVPQLRLGGYRRVNLRVFPYYIVRDPIIWIASVDSQNMESLQKGSTKLSKLNATPRSSTRLASCATKANRCQPSRYPLAA
jgi:hypothetical protein